MFAFWCLLKDFNKIRNFLRSIWQEYYDKKIGIHVASELSDKAYEIVQHITDDFAAEFPPLGTFSRVADRLDFEISMCDGEIESFSCSDTTSLVDGNFSVSTADFCVFQHLHAYPPFAKAEGPPLQKSHFARSS